MCTPTLLEFTTWQFFQWEKKTTCLWKCAWNTTKFSLSNTCINSGQKTKGLQLHATILDFEGSRKQMRPIFNVSPWKQILDFQLANAAFEVKKAKGLLDATFKPRLRDSCVHEFITYFRIWNRFSYEWKRFLDRNRNQKPILKWNWLEMSNAVS